VSATKDAGGIDTAEASGDATGGDANAGDPTGSDATGSDATGMTGDTGNATGSGGASGSAGTGHAGGAGSSGGTTGADGGVTAPDGASGALTFNPAELVFSASLSVTTTGVTRTVTLHNGTGSAVPILSLGIDGADAATFVLEGAPPLPTLAPGGDLALTVRFRPAANAPATTVYSAGLLANDAAGIRVARAGLFGLAMNAGNSEPSLDQVARTLGYAINVGGTTTTLGTGSAPIGDEIVAPRFVKARTGTVTLQPVARYSPFETAPYGTYTGSNPNVTRSPLGAMSRGPADNVANRTLFPSLDAGTMTTFDPGAASFGIYAESASNVASLGTDGRLYQEDALNNDQAGVLPVHRVRVYPMKNRTGQAVADTYLVVCEEASNSDYQDYVFVVSNVAPGTN
jgi:hypothetical protein